VSRIISQLWRSFAYLLYLSICIEVALQGFYYVTAGDFLFRRIALPIYVSEPYAGFGNRPGLSFDHQTKEFRAHYFINKAGYRVPRPDVEYTVAKPANTYRVMILGPSFAFGWGVDYEFSFAGVLQQLLRERGYAREKKIEVINAGVPAMPLAPQIAWFDQMGRHYESDLVIQFVYGSMAVKNVSEPPYAVNDKGYLVSPYGDGGWRWRERLKNLATVFYGWVLWTKLSTARPSAQLEEKGGAVQEVGREIAASTKFDPLHPEVRGATQVYTRLANVVRAAGAQLLVVHFPRSYAIHREDESRWQHLGLLDIERQMAFDGDLVHHLNECRIPSIDITQQLQKSAQAGKRMYYWLDIHWTPAGNITAARAVADYLVGRS